MFKPSFKVSVASLFAATAFCLTIAHADIAVEVDLADKPHRLIVPIGQQAYLLVSNSAPETQTMIFTDHIFRVEPDQTVRIKLERQELLHQRFLTYRVWDQEVAAAKAREALLASAAQAATVVSTGSPTIGRYDAPVYEEKAEPAYTEPKTNGGSVRGYW